MNKLFLSFLFISASCGMLAACSSSDGNNALDDDTAEEFQLKGTISGSIHNEDGQAIAGVSVTLDSAGHSTVSDSAGNYTIPNVPKGTYAVFFHKEFYRDTTVNGIAIAIDQELKGVDMVMVKSLDSSSANISGQITHLPSNSTVRLVFLVDADTALVSGFTYNTSTGTFGAITPQPSSDGLLQVMVFDSLAHLTGYQELTVAARSSQIQVPLFQANNLVPTLALAKDTLYGIVGDTLPLALSASDTGFHAGLAYATWSCDGKAAHSATLAQALVLGQETGIHQCEATVWDIDSNATRQKFVLALESLLRMAEVPADTFTMGSGIALADAIAHKVTMSKDFRIGVAEVTLSQFAWAINRELSQLTLDTSKIVAIAKHGQDTLFFFFAGTSDPQTLGYSEGKFQSASSDKPAAVTWYGAAFFCNILSRAQGLDAVYDETTWQADFNKNGYRLPTEAEWEFAARDAGKSAQLYPGSDSPETVAWFAGNVSDGLPVGVAKKSPNGLGLYDMAGNMSEWTNDWYASFDASAQTDPTGPSTGQKKVIKGGNVSSYSASMDATTELNPRNRSQFLPGEINNNQTIGFRISIH